MVTGERTTVQRVFEAWSIEIPVMFATTFVRENHYWHAYDVSRSVSLTSIVLTEQGRVVPATEIARQLIPTLEGRPINDLPRGLLGAAVSVDVRESARASRALMGLLTMDGRALLVTITGDDLDWARRVWLSIRGHPVRHGRSD